MKNRDVLIELLKLSEDELDSTALLCTITGECQCTYANRELMSVDIDTLAGGKRAVVFSG